MEAYAASCMFSPSSCTTDFSTTNSCYDYYLATLQDPSEWIYEGNFHVSSLDHSCQGLNMEFNQELSIFHLLKAFGEANKEGFIDLARVILARLCEKASPIGTTMERLSHYLLVHKQSDPRSEYLKQESIKNYNMAFRAFYEITPYGRFAHFAANAAIQEAVLRDMEAVHIVDFDIGDGIQWPPLLSALGPRRQVRVTCIDMEDDYRFQRTKATLACFARTMGLKLRVDKMSLEELVLEKRKIASEGEWLVFNCMVGLPHMRMTEMKGKSQAIQFMNVAQDLVGSSKNSGILTFGNGSSGHEQFSDGHLLHGYGLFESMEWHFPSNLSLARTTMECLFVGACDSSSFGFLVELPIGSNLKGCRVSKQNLMEAEEMVRGGHYGVKVEGDVGNEMVLEWKGTALVRVCAWR